MLVSASLDEKSKTLTLVLTLDPPKASSTGKTLGVASTHGNMPTDVKVDGKTVIVGANAYIRR